MSDSSPQKKKNILISFDEDLFIEGKKILFRKNLTPQQLMTFIFHQASLDDDEVMEVIERASKHYSSNITKDERKKIKVINRDILYDIIEQGKNS
jgi:hypothetical protein